EKNLHGHFGPHSGGGEGKLDEEFCIAFWRRFEVDLPADLFGGGLGQVQTDTTRAGAFRRTGEHLENLVRVDLAYTDAVIDDPYLKRIAIAFNFDHNKRI